MKRIFKYSLQIIAHQEILTHRYSQILDVQVQNGRPHIWLVVDEDEPTETVVISIFGTGQEIPKDFYINNGSNNYAGTFQLDDYVWHVFASGHFTSHQLAP